jgi:hypothetical protein
MCSTRQLWTSDAGRTWHDTRTLSGNFAGSGGRIYFWQKGTLRLLAPLPAHASGTRLAAQTVDSVANGTIVGAASVAGGVAALVSNRVGGQGWDNAPRVLVAHGSSGHLASLPSQSGDPLAQTIRAAGKRLVVTAVDYTQQPARTLTWTSVDGGATWKPGG